ncbi:response regulator transcription factor [Novipirellula caenicola]|uniref:HTH luxR-type domain-containing protein n=1 Tax=Novipirellula caenicola TaxID=1536901 RepID=A0ABP9VNC8_9BACT
MRLDDRGSVGHPGSIEPSQSPTANELESANTWEKTHPGTRLVNWDEWPQIAAHLHLTQRELDVIVLLFYGHTRNAIGRMLEIQPRTVRQYVEQLHLKLEVQDRVALVLKVVECRDALRTGDEPREEVGDDDLFPASAASRQSRPKRQHPVL